MTESLHAVRTETAAETTAAADVQPSVLVVEAVAETTGTDPLELPPLYDAIDPDALDVLVADGGQSHVEFAYDGHEIAVHEDGAVAVDGETVDR